MNVLLVERSLRTAATLAVGLRDNGFDVVHVDNCTEAVCRATENSFDVILLGVTKPGPGGYEVLRRLRQRRIRTPVLILTGLDNERDHVEALTLGADDYLVTPFAFVVLVARLRALVRRTSVRAEDQRDVFTAQGE